MNENLKIGSGFNLEDTFIDFDYKNKLCNKSQSLIKIFDYLNLKDTINFKNTNKFFHSKFEISFLKKILKKKLFSRKEHAFLLRKILITYENIQYINKDLKIDFRNCKEIYKNIQDNIAKTKQDPLFSNPISKAEYKTRKSCRKIEKDHNNSNNSTSHNHKDNQNNSMFDDKSDTQKEIKLFKFKQNFDWIRKDIKRTFHQEEFKLIEGEEKLSRILEAISFNIDEIGYVQGMNFIAGALLIELKNEEEAFFIFYIFLKKYDMMDLYKKFMPDFYMRIYQINIYVKQYMPNVYSHFINNNIPFDMIYSKWILTIFSSYVNFDTLFLFYSLFAIDNWKAVIKFSLILIDEIANVILNCDIESLGRFLRDDYIYYHNNLIKIVEIYNSQKFHVTDKQLDECQQAYYVKIVEEKLNCLDSDLDLDQFNLIKEYKDKKEKIGKIVKVDIENFKKQMIEIDRVYSIQLSDYIFQLNLTKNLKKKIELLIEKKYGLECTKKIFSDELNFLNEKKYIEEINIYKDDIGNKNSNLKKKKNSFTSGLLSFFGLGKKQNSEIKKNYSDNNNDNNNNLSNSNKKIHNRINNFKIDEEKKIHESPHKNINVINKIMEDKAIKKNYDENIDKNEFKKNIKICSQTLKKSNTLLFSMTNPNDIKNVKRGSFFFSPLKRKSSMRSKEEIINQELFKFHEEITELEMKISLLNHELLLSFENLDKRKFNYEKIEKEKNSNKQLFENYLFMYDIKDKEMIRSLCDKLRLTENFYKNFKI